MHAHTHTVDLPTITEQPLNLLNFIPGQDATFTVVATGINVRYEWQYSNGSTLELKPNYEGVTSATLTVSAVTRKDAGSYRCAVINPAGTVYTEHVRIMLCKYSQTITKLFLKESQLYYTR